MKSLILLLVIALAFSESNLRNLGFKYNVDKTYSIKSFNVLGSTLAFKERVGVRNGKAFCQLIIASNTGTKTFGISGTTSDLGKTYSIDATILKFSFPPIPTLQIFLIAQGSLSCSIKESSGKLSMTLVGTLYANAAIAAGVEPFHTVTVGAKGTIINLSHSYIINSNNQVSHSGKAVGGTITVNAKGKYTDMNLFDKSYTLWNGWSVYN